MLSNCRRTSRRLGQGVLGLTLLAGMSACHPPRNALAEWLPSPNYNARRPQLVVLHHTAEPSFDVSLRVLQTQNSGGPVSCHYLIGRGGRIAQLVADDHRAYHAGGGTWGPYRDLNSLSIGIELDNTGFEPFPQAQIDALVVILEDVTQKYRIPRTQVTGHADVDPVRKQDPSGFFPWKQLADSGFGLWPDDTLVDPPAGFDPWLAMRTIGYSLKDPAASLRAFRRHYRALEAGELDDLDRRILFNLQTKVLQDGVAK